MGAPPQLLRGRMPVFYYLSEEEEADVYLFLTRYPPYSYPQDQVAALDVAVFRSRPDPNTADQTPSVPETSLTRSEAVGRQNAITTTDAQMAAFPARAALLVSLMLGLGVAFTVYEMRRLSASSKSVIPREEAEVEHGDVEVAELKRESELDPEMVA